MGSGLIYAVIVALWAVVLVPMWLRRHDDVAEVRQVDRFSKAMRILSRRGDETDTAAGSVSTAADGPAPFNGSVISASSTSTDASSDPAPVASMRPSAPMPPLTSISLGPRRRPVDEDTAQVFVSRPRSAQRRHEQAGRRRNRQRVLLGLAGLLLITGGLVGMGVVGFWAPGAALLLSAGYLVMLRRYAIVDQRAQRELARQVGRADRFTAVIDLSDDASATRVDSSVEGANDTIVPNRSEGASLAAGPVDANLAGDVAWRPNTPPLPTYVTAPAATRVPRVIDRTGLDGLTAHHMVEMVEAARLASGIDANPAEDEVWAEATAAPEASAVAARDAVFDREWFEADVARDGFAEAVQDEVEAIVGDRPRRRHPSHDEYRRASGA